LLIAWYPITIIPPLADAMIGLGLQIAALICLVASVVLGVRAHGFGDQR
jgi:hypothetical protein